MEFYHLTLLPEHVKEILAEPDDPLIVSQEWDAETDAYIKSHLPALVEQLCLKGAISVFADEWTVTIVRRKTAWICEFDTKAKKGLGIKEYLKSYKAFFKLLAEKTDFVKSETRTPLEKLAKTLSKVTKTDIEGVCKQSYRTQEGIMIDEYIIGVVIKREDKPCQLS